MNRWSVDSISAGGAIVMLEEAHLCQDCNAITKAQNDRCLRCGSQSLLPLANVLNRDSSFDRDFLNEKFIEAMNDIGRYGFETRGRDSFEARLADGDVIRGIADRNKPSVIADHARDHFDQYLNNVPHDHFRTTRHQLAAVAYNAMLEFVFAGLEREAERDAVL